MWVLMKAVSIAVKGFADCWSLLYSVLIYFLCGLLGANARWGLPCCKHGILEAVKQLFLVLSCDFKWPSLASCTIR